MTVSVPDDGMAPPALLPYQQRWIQDPAKVKVCEKSRRIGITWAEASDNVLTAATSKADGGMDVWYVGYNQAMAEEYIRAAAGWAKGFQRAATEVRQQLFRDDDADRDILTYSIDFASGFRISALSSAPSNLRGKQGTVVIDEAAFHPRFPELVKAAMALLIWGGKVRIISSHQGDDSPFNGLVQECRAGKKSYSVHRYTFEEAVKQGLYRRICLVTGDKWSVKAEKKWVEQAYADYGSDAEEELDVVPSSGSGAYLTRTIIEACMDRARVVHRLALSKVFVSKEAFLREGEVLEWCERTILPELQRLSKERQSYFGMDFGRSGDLSVLVPIVQEQDLRLTIPFTIEMSDVPFEQQRQALFYVVDRLPRFRSGALDARGNGAYLAEVAMQRYGAVRIAQVALSQPWYIEHMPKLKAAFEDRSIAIPADADMLDDLRAIKMYKGVAKIPDKAKTRGKDGRQRHGDAAIALALGVFATKSSAPPSFGVTVDPAPGTYQPKAHPPSPRLFTRIRKRIFS
ncbi:MAG: hypothetical protein HQL97_04470 [Magnetococcales bacterium]|nr:hypothetical protein [Magnetococcales bacterium]